LEAPSLPADAVAGGFALPLVAEGAPEVAESLAALVTFTIGAGVSESSADPAHDLAVGVRLQRLEGQLVARLAGDLDREREVHELARGDPPVRAVAGERDPADLLVDRPVVGLDGLGQLLRGDLGGPPGAGLVHAGHRPPPLSGCHTSVPRIAPGSEPTAIGTL
jgi:hypothetical protein